LRSGAPVASAAAPPSPRDGGRRGGSPLNDVLKPQSS